MSDPIVEEIRKVRRAHAAKFNNDLAAICADIRRMEKESGREYVTFPPRRIEPTKPAAGENGTHGTNAASEDGSQKALDTGQPPEIGKYDEKKK